MAAATVRLLVLLAAAVCTAAEYSFVEVTTNNGETGFCTAQKENMKFYTPNYFYFPEDTSVCTSFDNLETSCKNHAQSLSGLEGFSVYYRNNGGCSCSFYSKQTNIETLSKSFTCLERSGNNNNFYTFIFYPIPNFIHVKKLMDAIMDYTIH